MFETLFNFIAPKRHQFRASNIFEFSSECEKFGHVFEFTRRYYGERSILGARCYCANGMKVEKNTALKFAYHWVILLKVTVILWCKYMTNYFEGLYLECHN